MLNINYSLDDGNFVSQRVCPALGNPAEVLNFQHMLMVPSALNNLQPVALRCEALLDAMELDNHGYHHGYFERKNRVSEETFITLNRLGLKTVAYFCDLNGASFDVIEMAALASKYKVTLCKVLLPFCPTDLSEWDEWQWRIFDSRLTLALHCKVRNQRVPFFTDKEHCYAYLQ